jgi:hypothetical protein
MRLLDLPGGVRDAGVENRVSRDLQVKVAAALEPALPS